MDNTAQGLYDAIKKNLLLPEEFSLNTPKIAYVDTVINFKNTGLTTLFTQGSREKSFYTLAVLFFATSITGVLPADAPLVGPTISVGTNSSTFDNIMNSQAVTQLVAGDAGKIVTYNLATSVVPAAPADLIKLSVEVGAQTDGNYTGRIGLLGFYQ